VRSEVSSSSAMSLARIGWRLERLRIWMIWKSRSARRMAAIVRATHPAARLLTAFCQERAARERLIVRDRRPGLLAGQGRDPVHQREKQARDDEGHVQADHPAQPRLV